MLLVLQFDDGTCVPLADGTVAALERALLAMDEPSCIAELTQAIVRDPALAVWTARHANERDHAVIRTATGAAQWLADHLAEKLTAAMPPAQLNRVPPAEVQRLAFLYAGVVSAARHKHLAEEADIPLADSATYWSAIMVQRDWLLAAWPMGPQSAPSAGPERVESVVGGELVDFFSAEVPGLERRLPALVAKLCNFQRRLADFNSRLEQEKLAALKELAYGAGHEINNPLANIAARAQTLLEDESDPERRRKLAAIHRQAMRAHEMIADLMLFARPPELKLAPCELGAIARQVVADLADPADERNIRLGCEVCEPTIVLEADATQLAVALHAVVVNAIEAVGAGGQVDVLVREQRANDRHWAEVVVRDNGPGISEDVRRHMFDPFFSGREAGRGLGFGLSKCWRIVTDHGGQVVVASTPLGGCELSILLPIASQAAGASQIA